MKRSLCLLLSVILFSSLLTVSALSGVHERVVLGADLNEEQIAKIYEDFGVERGSMRELTVNNAEEREVLGGILDESAIGTASYSCVYVKRLETGSGCKVERHNISWCTEEMYRSALATAGITDVKIIVSAPFPVSGTCALVGIYKAYEDITGNILSDSAKRLGAEELLFTGVLSDEVGNSYDAAGIVEDLKEFLAQSEELSDTELAEKIRSIAAERRVSFSDAQMQQLMDLSRRLQGLQKLRLDEVAEDAKNAAEKLGGWREKLKNFQENWQQTRQKLGEFSQQLSEWGSGVRESWQSMKEHTQNLTEAWKNLFGKDKD